MKNNSESLLSRSLQNAKSPKGLVTVSIQESPDIMPPIEPFFYHDLYSEFRSKPQSMQNVPKPLVEEESPRGAIPIPKSRKSSRCDETEVYLSANTFKPTTPPGSLAKKAPQSLDEHELMFRLEEDNDAVEVSKPNPPRMNQFESQIHSHKLTTLLKNFTPPVISSPVTFAAPKLAAPIQQPQTVKRYFFPSDLTIHTGYESPKVESTKNSEESSSVEENDEHDLLFSFEEAFFNKLDNAFTSKEKVTPPTPLPTREPLKELRFFPPHSTHYPDGFSRTKAIDIPTPKKGNEATKKQPCIKL